MKIQLTHGKFMPSWDRECDTVNFEIQDNRSVYFNKKTIFLILILLMGLILRVYVTDFNRPIADSSDSAAYDYAARNLIKYGVLANDRDGAMYRGEVAISPASNVMPGYPIFLAMVYIINDALPFAYMVQVFLSFAVLCLIYLLLKEIGISFFVSVFVTAVAAIYPAFLYNLDILLTENLSTALLTAAIYGMVRFMRRMESIRHPYFYVAGITAVLMAAVMVRAQALPFLAVEIFFLLIYATALPLKKRIRCCGIVIIVALAFLVPLWIRNWLDFHQFWLLTEAGIGPQIWGAQPYFLDMSSTNGVDIDSLIFQNKTLSETLYWKWRVFGFFNFMWYDFWDENLVHPYKILSMFRLIHPLLIVPTIALIPVFIRRSKKEVLLIGCVPLLFTLMCLPYHGLARYVYPSIPCVLVLFGVIVEKVVFKIRKKKSDTDIQVYEQKSIAYINLIFRYAYWAFSIVFSIILLYSVYIFSWSMGTEMSNYRLARTYDVSSSQVESFPVLESQELISDRSLWRVDNVEQIGDTTYQGIWDGIPILHVQVPESQASLSENSVITKVELDMPGGYLYDYCTVYWTGSHTPEISENDVYGRFPRTSLNGKQTVYIDDNVSSLMIVPCVFRGTEFSINSIRITKYQVPEMVQ